MQVDNWRTTVCRMTRSKVRVTNNWQPLERSRPSVPHQAKFFLILCCLIWRNKRMIEPDGPCVVLQMMSQYSSVISRNTLPPHIFAISDTAFSSLCADDRSQCCVVSGESGAGKCFRVRCYYLSTKKNMQAWFYYHGGTGVIKERSFPEHWWMGSHEQAIFWLF